MTRIGVVVRDLERAARAHSIVYGIERWHVGGQVATGVDPRGITFRLTQPTDGPLAAFLARRGEGIHALALAVVRAGEPDVLGGCGVGPVTTEAAADEEWVFGAPWLRPAPRVAHAGVAVDDLDERTAAWDQRFGPLEWRFTDFRPESATLDGRPVAHEFRLARAEVGGFEIELIQPTVEPTHYRREFLDRFGEGVHHLLLWPALDEAAWRALRTWMEAHEAPVAMSGVVRSGAAEYCYFDTRGMLGGYLVEAICRRE